MPTGHDEHLLAKQDEAASVFIELAMVRYPDRTPAQVQRIGKVMFETFHTPSENDDSNAAYFIHLEKTTPELFRRAPTHLQAHAYLVAQLGDNPTPQTRITKWREIENLNADELMRLVPHDAKLSDDPAPVSNSPPSAPALTAAQRANKWTEADAILAQRGFDPNTMDVAKRVEYRREIEKERALPSLQYVNEARAMIAAGKTWSQLSYVVQRTAHDQAKAAGTTLVAQGIDVTK